MIISRTFKDRDEVECYDSPEGTFSYIHLEEACKGTICIFHNPTHHGMRRWKMRVRPDKLIERVCSHGIGHPDPDSAAWASREYMTDKTIHGCDGCCKLSYLYLVI